ncbi:hypothetical protein [Nonomuraea sp. 10N515B]|uniref:hypothetical protein n=1 Tax=Nonomuraea sp. 10N515B TaxID=3457422 RepID=UPI003FCE826C
MPDSGQCWCYRDVSRTQARGCASPLRTGSIDYAIDGAFVPESQTHVFTQNEPLRGGAIHRRAGQTAGGDGLTPDQSWVVLALE